VNEFGLFFGSFASVPFVLLTIALVEWFRGKQDVSGRGWALVGGVSPALVAVVGFSVGFYRYVTYDQAGADIGFGLWVYLSQGTFAITLVFSVIYLGLRTDFFSRD
jgi:hypothetical protein